MSIAIARSKRRAEQLRGWIIDESTFQVLNENWGRWCAIVTTSHFAKEGIAEETFPVLVDGDTVVALKPEELPILTDWCLKQVK